ncbi:MAG: GNAT family N-acetyltransferase [Patescibacteria group bacterium]
MNDYKTIEINDFNIDKLQPLAGEALADGDKFIQKTIDEWKSGANTFSKEGEKFWAIVIDDEYIACGGLNRDPYTEDGTVGRVRHVYVLKKYRGQGYSKIILNLIIGRAREYFSSLRLSTYNSIAASLYQSLGFEKVDEHKANYIIRDLAALQ